jgi:lipopolysaccharide export system permease protein
VFGNILQRSIFWELIKAFALSLVAMTGICVLAGIVAEASQRGLTPSQILAVTVLFIPSLMPYIIPSTTLFATCLVYGRLAHDNEIVAIKAAGINVLTVIWPGVLLGVLTSAGTLALYYEVIPETQYVLRAQFLKDVEEFLYSMLRNENCINHPKLSYAIWVRQVQGRRLLDATFKRRDAHGQYDLVARAREAELRVGNKEVLVHMRHGEVLTLANGASLYFEDKVWPVPMPEPGLEPERQRKAREMTWQQLHDKRQEILQQIEKVSNLTSLAAAWRGVQGTPIDLPQHRHELEIQRRTLGRDLAAITLELYMRPAVAGGCLCFVLVGCPVGIWFSKRDYLSAFITCFLPIVVLYYPLLLCGINLTRNGQGHPILNLWSCNVAMIAISLLLLRRLIRH